MSVCCGQGRHVCRGLGSHSKPALRLGGFHQLSVVAMNNGGGVAKLASHAPGIACQGESGACVAMPEPVRFPPHARSLCGRLLSVIEGIMRPLPDQTGLSSVGDEPRCQGIMDGDNAAACRLGLGRADHDATPSKVNVRPFETFNLSRAQASKRAQCNARDKLGTCGGKKLREFKGSVRGCWCCANLDTFNAFNRIVACVASGSSNRQPDSRGGCPGAPPCKCEPKSRRV